MKQITPPLEPNVTGDKVCNLQQALFYLFNKNIFKTYQAPEIPTAEKLNRWIEMSAEEKASSSFGEGTRQLVLYFQIQQGLGDNFNGIVEQTTAAKMNELLTSLGAFEHTVTSSPRLTLFKNDLANNPEQTIAFEKHFEEKEGDWSAIKTELQSDPTFSPGTIDKLAFTHDVANWTKDNTILVNTFQQDNTTNSLADIAAKYDRKSFTDLLGSSNSLKDSESVTADADGLYNGLFQLAPTAMLKNIVVQHADTLFADASIGGGVSTFLNNVKDDFNIKTTSVYEAFKNDNAFEGIAPEHQSQVKEEVKSLQRVTALSPVPEAVPVLLNANLHSALSISSMPEEQFVQTLAIQLGDNGEAIARQVHEHAVNIQIRNEQALISLKEAQQGTGIAMVDDAMGDASNAASAALEENNLSWDMLFGDADFCECGECTSVYSTSAYFVELLQYLRSYILDPTPPSSDRDISKTSVQKLFDRRPDLACLQLTCQNTNTVLPYIDLVNEVMESYVAFNQTKPFNVSEDETSGELLAQPLHTEQTIAYQLLNDAVFPFSLPYHQPVDAARIYLDYLNTSRFELIDTFRSSRNSQLVLEPLIGYEKMTALSSNATDLDELYQGYFDRAADAEYLGLTQQEYIIVTEEDFVSKEYWDRQTSITHTIEDYWRRIGIRPLPVYYGYDAASTDMLSDDENTKAGLTFVKSQFLKRTGLQYLELVEMLKTQSLNPNMPHGQALGIMEKIPLNYQALKWLVNNTSGITDEVKYKSLIDAIVYVTNPEWSGNRPRIDPCNNVPTITPISKEDITNWEYDHFEDIGKIIVLDNAKQSINGKISSSSLDLVNVKDSKLISISTGKEAGSIDKTGLLLGLDGKPLGGIPPDAIFTGSNGEKGSFFIWVVGMYLIIEKTETCDLDTVRLVHLDGSPLIADEYNRIHRFIRLWRKLSWSINETDNALVSFASADFEISSQLLHQLVAVKKINEQTGLELIKLFTFWNAISSVSEQSLYKKLFLTHNLLGVDSVFQADQNGVYLADSTLKIIDHVPVLMAALTISADNIRSYH